MQTTSPKPATAIKNNMEKKHLKDKPNISPSYPEGSKTTQKILTTKTPPLAPRTQWKNVLNSLVRSLIPIIKKESTSPIIKEEITSPLLTAAPTTTNKNNNNNQNSADCKKKQNQPPIHTVPPTTRSKNNNNNRNSAVRKKKKNQPSFQRHRNLRRKGLGRFQVQVLMDGKNSKQQSVVLLRSCRIAANSACKGL